MIKKFLSILIKRKYLFICLIGVITVISMFSLRNLEVNNRLSIWFPENDENLAEYNRFKDIYGNDETTVIAIESNSNWYRENNIVNLKNIALSLDSIEYTGTPLYILSDLISHRMLHMILSADSTITIIILPLNNDSIAENSRDIVIGNIRNIMARYPYTYHLGGITAIYSELNRITLNNVSVFVMMAFVIIFMLSGIILRNIRVLIAAGISIIVTIIIITGAMSIMGVNINMITSMIPVLILIYGLSDVIYLYIRGGNNRKTEDMLIPCLFTSLTTCIGYIALTVTSIPCLKELGIWGGAAVITEFFVTAIVYSLFNIKQNDKIVPGKLIRSFVLGRWKAVIIVIVLLIVSTGGILQLKTDTNTLGFFRKNNRVTEDIEWIESNMGNILPLEILVKYRSVPHMLTLVRDVPGILIDSFNIQSIGITDFKSSDVNANQTFIDTDSREFRVTAMIPMESANSIRSFSDSIVDVVKQVSGTDVHLSGYIPLYVSLIDYIQMSQQTAFPLAFISIIIFMIILFGIRSGIAAVIPNIMPLFAVLGIMGFAGIYLDIGTIIVIPIILGISVDDTIHYLYARKNETTGTVHLPMFITSLSLMTGFSILIFSQLMTIVYFGILSAAAIIIAYIGDAVILPSIMRRESQ